VSFNEKVIKEKIVGINKEIDALRKKLGKKKITYYRRRN